MPTPLSLVTRQARLLALRDQIDAGGGGALWLYEGVMPVEGTPEIATAAVFLGAIELAVVSGAIGVSGNIATYTLTSPQTGNMVATGIVGWVRAVDGTGLGVMDLTAGGVASGAQAIFSDTQMYAGGEVQLLSCVIGE